MYLHSFPIAAGLALACCAASAHITLAPGGATAGTVYDAAFRVGHACKNAQSTTGITVRLPDGFSFVSAQPRAGWTLSTTSREVSWKADTSQAALPAKDRAEFIVRGGLAQQLGTLWFKVLQTCENGSADWAQIPDANAAGKPEFPAVRLELLAPGVAPVDVRDAWARAAVPGQSGTGAFMKLSAPSGLRLVGASTPAAGVTQVHEMKMEGDVMRMREVPGGLDLPARQVIELKPGGYHIMLMDLKQPLAKGASVPLTLRFEDGNAVQSSVELQVPVRGSPDGNSAAAAGQAH